jgi:hypothetical protein
MVAIGAVFGCRSLDRPVIVAMEYHFVTELVPPAGDGADEGVRVCGVHRRAPRRPSSVPVLQGAPA